jgi:putative Holliday junction resolvase
VSGSPRPIRLLAVDHGDRRTGLAATDPTGTIVVPLAAIHHTNDRTCADAIATIAKERGSQRIVVGLPLVGSPDGTGAVGRRAARALAFVAILRAALTTAAVACDVVTYDESFTTDQAHERLREGGIKAARRKQLADSVAALILLERYRASGA